MLQSTKSSSRRSSLPDDSVFGNPKLHKLSLFICSTNLSVNNKILNYMVYIAFTFVFFLHNPFQNVSSASPAAKISNVKMIKRNFIYFLGLF